MHVRSPTVLFWVAGLVLVLLIMLLHFAGGEPAGASPAPPSDASANAVP